MSDFGLYRLSDDGALHPSFNDGAPLRLASPQEVSNAAPTGLVRRGNRVFVVGRVETADGGRLMLHSAPIVPAALQLSVMAGVIDVSDLFVGDVQMRDVDDPAVVADRFGQLVIAAGVDLGVGNRASLLRVEPDVRIDRSFAGLSHDWNAGSVIVSDMVRDASGAFVVVGGLVQAGQVTPALARYDWRGRLDATFGTGGILTLTAQEKARLTSVAIDRMGRIVAGGESTRSGDTETLVFRCDAAGLADSSFGADGLVFHPAGSGQAIALTSDGAIVVGGVNTRQSGPDLGFLVKFDDTGAVATAFGTDGVVMAATPASGWPALARGTAVPAEFDRLGRVFDLFVDYDDRVVLVGSAFSTSGRARAAIARILPDGDADTSFGGTGLVLLAPNDQVDESNFATAVMIEPTGGYWVTAPLAAL